MSQLYVKEVNMSDVQNTETDTETINPNDWISQAQAARLAGVSRTLLHFDVRRGLLRTVTIDGQTLVHNDEVQKIKDLHPKAGLGKK